MGISLSACCGFRVFLPFFISSSLSYFGGYDIVPGFDWMNSPAAVVGFGVASIVEIIAYYIPIVDHALDAIAAPLSIAAGTVISASLFTEMHPGLQWGLAALLGGGAAGTVQAGTTVTRLTSAGLTAGLGNPVVATIENFLATVLSFLAFIMPILVFMTIVVMITTLFLLYRKLRRKKLMKD